MMTMFNPSFQSSDDQFDSALFSSTRSIPFLPPELVALKMLVWCEQKNTVSLFMISLKNPRWKSPGRNVHVGLSSSENGGTPNNLAGGFLFFFGKILSFDSWMMTGGPIDGNPRCCCALPKQQIRSAEVSLAEVLEFADHQAQACLGTWAWRHFRGGPEMGPQWLDMAGWFKRGKSYQNDSKWMIWGYWYPYSRKPPFLEDAERSERDNSYCNPAKMGFIWLNWLIEAEFRHEFRDHGETYIWSKPHMGFFRAHVEYHSSGRSSNSEINTASRLLRVWFQGLPAETWKPSWRWDLFQPFVLYFWRVNRVMWLKQCHLHHPPVVTIFDSVV